MFWEPDFVSCMGVHLNTSLHSLGHVDQHILPLSWIHITLLDLLNSSLSWTHPVMLSWTHPAILLNTYIPLIYRPHPVNLLNISCYNLLNTYSLLFSWTNSVTLLNIMLLSSVCQDSIVDIYGIILWGSTYKLHFSKLFIMQKKIVRSIVREFMGNTQSTPFLCT